VILNQGRRSRAAPLLIVFVLALLSRTLPTSAQDTKGRKAEIDLQVVDGLGDVIRNPRVLEFKNSSSGRDLANKFRQVSDIELNAASVMYGRYELLIHADGFKDLEVPVDVSQDSVLLEICVRTTTVHVVALDSFGTMDLGSVTVRLFRDRVNDIDWSAHFQDNVGQGIPYGSYTLQIAGDGMSPLEQRVDVFQPDVWVVVGLNVAIEKPHFIAPTLELSGRINNLGAGEEPVYVKLVGLYCNCSMDTRAKVEGSSATFTIKSSDPSGKYLLTVIGKSGVLGTRPVDIRAQDSITIDLSQQR
jgi:hypothetical protein